MKRIIQLMVLLLLLGLVACGESESDTPAANDDGGESVATEMATETEEADEAAEEAAAAADDSGADSETDDQPVEADDGDEAADDEPSVVRIGWTGFPDTLNPGMTEMALTNSILELVYDSMYQLELDGTYTLELAEAVSISDDGLVYTFDLQDDVTFHDGQPLTASDVVFSYNLYAVQEEFAILPTYTSFFASVEAADDNTVVLTLTDPIPNLESQLIYLWVLPEHIWGELDAAAVADFDNQALIGSGPLRLLEVAQDSFIRLGAVEDHFLHDPQVDEFIFQSFDSADVLVQALRTGQVDMITELPNTAVASLRNEDNIAVVAGAPVAPTVKDIILNQIDPEACPTDAGGLCTGHPALRDRNVRLALSHATDKQQIIDVVLLGLGTPGRTLIPDGQGVFFNDELEDYAFDPALANQILDDAGYLDSDGDGIREMPDGTMPLNFRVNWDQDEIDSPRLVELLSGMWAEIGIGTELQGLDFDALLGTLLPDV